QLEITGSYFRLLPKSLIRAFVIFTYIKKVGAYFRFLTFLKISHIVIKII
ncbi:MAG: hypothetical protein RIT35_297, partial [Pseudomonadota bacterium]